MGRKVKVKTSLDVESSKLLTIARTVEAAAVPLEWRKRHAETLRMVARELLAPPAIAGNDD